MYRRKPMTGYSLSTERSCFQFTQMQNLPFILNKHNFPWIEDLQNSFAYIPVHTAIKQYSYVQYWILQQWKPTEWCLIKRSFVIFIDQEKEKHTVGEKKEQKAQPINQNHPESLSWCMWAKLSAQFSNFEYLFRSCIISLDRSIN